MMKRHIVNSYTTEGRKAIHKKPGRNIDTNIMHYLMRNPIPYRSAAYNDNRISLYCAQFGKCAITGEKLEIGDIHCHHKLTKHLGGSDEYKNLIIVSESVHRLIHATNPETIRKYLQKLNLDAKQLRKLNKLRSLANIEKPRLLGGSGAQQVADRSFGAGNIFFDAFRILLHVAEACVHTAFLLPVLPANLHEIQQLYRRHLLHGCEFRWGLFFRISVRGGDLLDGSIIIRSSPNRRVFPIKYFDIMFLPSVAV